MEEIFKNNVASRVRELLTKKPHFRDNDAKVVASIWWIDLKRKGYDPTNMNVKELFDIYISHKNLLTVPDNIYRQIRLAKEHHIHLRGQFYKQKGKEKQAQKELGYGQ
jgi:hypothetical protein